jgi:Histidine kinase-, DNA gyrase B-, and HSP90-like ATPase
VSALNGSRLIEIRPDVAMYAAFARLNYRPWYALAEFVDNALQSFLSNHKALSVLDKTPTLSVTIEILDQEILIRDNAAGIARGDFPRAFLPASPPQDTSGLSEFGLGMKAASCWFARCWSVCTTALGDPVESTISYDVPTITAQHLDRLPIAERPVSSGAHYTIVRLTDLNVRPKSSTIGKIKRHLASIYRLYIADGTLELTVDGERLRFEPAAFLRASRFDNPRSTPVEWRREFSLSLDENHRIWGWAGLLARASVANAGLSVFRRRRLIEGSYGEAYRPEILFRKSNSYTYQRLVGELNVEGFSVSHTKDGVQWEEWEDDLLVWLRQELDSEPLPLLRQAENYRARPELSANTLVRVASDTGQILAQRVPPLVDAQLQAPPDSGALPATLPESTKLEAKGEAEFSLVHARQRWHITVELISDESVQEWLEISKEERADNENRVQLRVNMAHPFVVRFASTDGTESVALVRMAVALAVAEITSRATGVRQSGTVRRNLNQLLRDALSGPIEAAEAGKEETP